jgi:D-glycero-D-manno-heptose 1,7-bisphosphate phosphatase
VAALFHDIRFVFLDRDGVINRKAPEGAYIARWSDFHILPGAESAIAALNRSGRRVIVVTNQRGVALGLYSNADVTALHERLQQHLVSCGAHIDGFYFCPHDREECDCRKPKTGLFEKAFCDFGETARTHSVLIGDSLPDIEAASSLQMRSILIQGDPSTQKKGADEAVRLATAVAPSLLNAVETYLPPEIATS